MKGSWQGSGGGHDGQKSAGTISHGHKSRPVAQQMAALPWAQWTQGPDVHIVHAVCTARNKLLPSPLSLELLE